jgi:hypothetical protein
MRDSLHITDDGNVVSTLRQDILKARLLELDMKDLLDSLELSNKLDHQDSSTDAQQKAMTVAKVGP